MTLILIRNVKEKKTLTTKLFFRTYFRDANLSRTKIGRFFFSNTPASSYPTLPPKKKAMIPPPHQIDPHTPKSTSSDHLNLTAWKKEDFRSFPVSS